MSVVRSVDAGGICLKRHGLVSLRAVAVAGPEARVGSVRQHPAYRASAALELVVEVA